jgi:hypothetical protein
MNVKEINCPLQGWQKHESMFLIVGFLGREILGIVRSELETEIIFSLTSILTNVRKCQLQSKSLEKLMFVSKNRPNDSKAGCKGSSNLVKFVETNVNLEK